MKIALVTGIFPPDHGGPASYVPKIAAALAQQGHEIVSIVTLSDTLDHDDSAYPFPVIRLLRGQGRLARLSQTIQTILQESRKADVVYLNGLVFEGIIATKFMDKRPVVVKVVGDLIWERARNQQATTLDLDDFQVERIPFKWHILRRLQGWYTAMADAVITPSDYLASIVKGWGVAPVKVNIIFNAVEIPSLPAKESPQYDLVTVARLVPWKGMVDLVTVAGQNGWSLLIVGDGPMREQLEAQARACNAKVSFAGQVPKAQVPLEICKARLFVLNSDYEGLPHIVLEAKATGTAVLATAAGGTPETIIHGVDGWLIPPANPMALAEGIRALLEDDALRSKLAERGKASIRERFSFDLMVRQTAETLFNVTQ